MLARPGRGEASAHHREVGARPRGSASSTSFEVAPRRDQDRDEERGREALHGATSTARPHHRSSAARTSASAATSASRPNWKKAIVTLARGRDHRLLRGRVGETEPWASRTTSRPVPGAASHDGLRLRGAHQGRSPRRSSPSASTQDGRAQHARPHHHAASAAAATSGATASSTSGATRSACPPRSRRSSTIPNRTARIALLHYADGEKRYILAPDGLEVGDTWSSAATARHQARQRAAAPLHPARHRRSTTSSCSTGGRPARSLGRHRRRSSWPRKATTRRSACPRARSARSMQDCQATIGQVSNIEHAQRSRVGKAGRTRWLGQPPAQPRRHHEPGRSPDRRRRGPSRRAVRHPVLAVGPARPRASRRATTSAPTAMIVKRRRRRSALQGED